MKTVNMQPVDSLAEVPPALLDEFRNVLEACGYVAVDDSELLESWNQYVAELTTRCDWTGLLIEYSFYSDDSTDGERHPIDYYIPYLDSEDDPE